MNRDLIKARKLAKKNYVDLVLSENQPVIEKNKLFSITSRKPVTVKPPKKNELAELKSFPSLEAICVDLKDKVSFKGIGLIKSPKYWNKSGKERKSLKSERKEIAKSDHSLGPARTCLVSPICGVDIMIDYPKPQRSLQGYKYSDLNTNRNLVKSNYIRKLFN